MTFVHTITDLPIENKYPKLIRDRIPEIIEADGRQAQTRVLDDVEYLQFLLKKVPEEAEELASATSTSNILEEIADLKEIFDAILELHGVSSAEIQAIQDEKRQKLGGFNRRLLMLKKALRE